MKFELALNHAGKEMEIGRYYLSRGHYTAAINRFRVVVEDYQTTTHTPEALYRLVEAYLSLGLTNEAQTAAAIRHNFRGTDWYVRGLCALNAYLRPATAYTAGSTPPIARSCREVVLTRAGLMLQQARDPCVKRDSRAHLRVIIVYQEQVMQIVQAIGGFSLGKSDLVRRAMGKKIKEEMDKLRGEFADGAQNSGFDG